MANLSSVLSEDLASKSVEEIERLFASQPEKGVEALTAGGMPQEQAERLIANPRAAAAEVKRQPGTVGGATAPAQAKVPETTPPPTAAAPEKASMAPPTPAAPVPPDNIGQMTPAPGLEPKPATGLSPVQMAGGALAVGGGVATAANQLSGGQPSTADRAHDALSAGITGPAAPKTPPPGVTAPLFSDDEGSTDAAPPVDDRKPALVSAGAAPKPIDAKEYEKVIDQSIKDLGTVPALKTDMTTAELNAWKQQNLELMKIYDDAKRSNQWSEVAETLGHALTQFAAAKKGAELGVDLSGVKFTKTDWLGRNAQLLDELKQKLGVQSENRRIDEDQMKNARDVLRDWQRRSAELHEKKANLGFEVAKENTRRSEEWNYRNQQSQQENAKNTLAYDSLLSAEQRAAASVDQKAKAAEMRFNATQASKGSPADKQAQSRRQLAITLETMAEQSPKERERMAALVPRIAAAANIPPETLSQIQKQAHGGFFSTKSGDLKRSAELLRKWDAENPVVGAKLGGGASGSFGGPDQGHPDKIQGGHRYTWDGTRYVPAT